MLTMTMDYIDSIDWHYVQTLLHEYQPALLGFVLTLGFLILLERTIFTPSTPSIRVPLPSQAEPGWNGQVLPNPSIIGTDPSTIQCYCPATGQLIDTIKTASTKEVDIAIEKAKAAQLKWRRTSFKQRARVLRTLLKFILEHQGKPNFST